MGVYLQLFYCYSHSNKQCSLSLKIPILGHAETVKSRESLPVEQNIPKVMKLETIHATPEQQEEMERPLKKKQ
jgi:hypothetical protein